MISALDPRVWLACAALAVGGFAAGYGKRCSGEAERWEARVRDAERAAALRLVRAHERQQEALTHANTATLAARRDAAAARGTADRLREHFAAAAAASACPAYPGPAASSAADLLADVQRRIDEAAGELAAVADERGIAGAACERAYDSLNH